MAVDIGSEAIARTAQGGWPYTRINKNNPASKSGTITSIDIWAWQDITGLIVGTFYKMNGNTLKCRDSEAIPGTITAGSKVSKEVTLAVEIGDYIGYYFTKGYIWTDTTGYAGRWYKGGAYITPGDEEDYTFNTGYTFSLGGYITPPLGWTGKISGVVNPAKIMGVDVANIHSVKGVVSA